MEEKWVVFYACDHIMVSNLGRVKRLRREFKTVRGIRVKKECIVKAQRNGNGYYHFLVVHEDKKRYYNVHAAIYHSFHGTKPDRINNKVVDHIDGNRTNNRLDNLQFITQSENAIKGARRNRNKPLYIRKRKRKVGHGYVVEKMIGKKYKHFGSFDTVEEAIAYRDMLIKNNWIVQ